MKKRLLVLMLIVSMLLTALPVASFADTAPAVTRISGSNRYETSINVSKSAFDKSKYAVIASGENYPDALVGGVLSGILEAPLLVSSKSSLSDSLISELKRLEVETVYVLGGENTIAPEIVEQLSEFNVERLSGSNRYETANEVAKKIESYLTEISNTFYADGRNFPDALAAAPYIAQINGILKLNSGNPINEGIAIGGESSVPGQVKRIAGTNRYETAIKIAEMNETVNKVVLVDGTNYPDALSASGYASSRDAVILLTHPKTLASETEKYLNDKKIKDIVIIGGENSVNSYIENKLKGVKPDPEPIPEPEPVPVKVLYDVIRVIDGDTIAINYNNKEEKVRLIGIDTPESVHPDTSKNTECGRIASEFTKSKLAGKKIELELDVQERDKYGRILGYVWLDGVMFNKTLLIEGMAQVSTYPPNVKYADEFVELQRQAREKNVGLWAMDCSVNTPDPEPNPVPGYDPSNPKDGLRVSPYPGRDIKGNISSSGEKIYHIPGQRNYKDTVIDESKGERWFATEDEAINAGWRKAKR